MSGRSDREPFRIFASGFNNRELNALKLFFKGPCKSRCRLVSEDRAELLLVDMDSVQGEVSYRQLVANFPELPIILTALNDPKRVRGCYLSNPIRASELLHILQQLLPTLKTEENEQHWPTGRSAGSRSLDVEEVCNHSELLHQPDSLQTGRIPDAPINRYAIRKDANQLDEQKVSQCSPNAADVHFDPNHYLLGHLLRARELAEHWRCAVQIEGLDQPITIDAVSNLVYCPLAADQLRSICSVPANEQPFKVDIKTIRLERRNNTQAEHLTELQYQRGLNAFIWQVALWTSKGRIPKGISLDDPVYISRWPNFTRLPVTPHALQIVACTRSHQRSLTEILECLKIPRQHLFSLFTAALCCGLAGATRRIADRAAIPPPLMAHHNRQMLAELLVAVRQSTGGLSRYEQS